jgi:hypothetical protein
LFHKQRFSHVEHLPGSHKHKTIMKKITITVVFVTLGFSIYAQSNSFLTLKDKFSGEKEVFSFKASGALARLALRIAGEDEWQDAMSEVRSIRFIVIPKEAFREQNLTVAGFTKFTKSDGFEEVARVRQHGDDVHVLVQGGKKKDNNRYLILVNESNEFIAFEVNGYINPEKIKKEIASTKIKS